MIATSSSDPHWRRWPDELEQRYLADGLWTDDLLGDIAAAHAHTAPDRLAVVDPRRRITYAQLERQVAIAAAALQWRFAPGGRVVVQLPNCAEFVVAVLALWRAGLVPVMSLPAHRHAEISSFVEQSDAVGFLSADRIGDFDQLALGERLRDEHPTLVQIVVGAAGTTEQRHVEDAPGLLRWDNLASEDSAAESPRPSAGDLALLQLSGGSTGTPKLIPRTHRDYLCSVRGSVEICEFDRDTVQLVSLPCAHNFALSSAGSLGTLMAGGTIVMAPDPSPATCFDLIARERVTVASVVPPVALLWLASPLRASYELDSLALLQVGGAKLSEEVARRVEPELDCRLQQVFGMAEGLVNYTRLDDDADVTRHTQGRPISDYDEVRVLDDEDRPVPDGEPGHLVTQGPYTIRSYYRAPQLQSRSFTEDGWYRTGDIVVRRNTGHLAVVGRAKEQINRGGEKIASEEIENHLLAHPAVHEATVVGEEDRMLGERVVAHVVVTSGEVADHFRSLRPSAALADIRGFLTDRGLATYKMPDRVRVVDELPRTGVGKTATTRLRRLQPDTA